MPFIFRNQTGNCEWGCTLFTVPGLQSANFKPNEITSYLHAGRLFTLEDAMVPDTLNPGYLRSPFPPERRIRSLLTGKYLTWESDPNSIHNGGHMGCDGTANNTNEVWAINYNGATPNNRYRFILMSKSRPGEVVAFERKSENSYRVFALDLGIDIGDERIQLLAKPRILDAPFKYFIRFHNGRYMSLQRNASEYPYVRLSTNADIYETFQLIPIKYPNVYAIYCPHWNAYLAEDTHTNGPTTLGYRDNGMNSYNPFYFPEAQFRIHYSPQRLQALQINRFIGKFILQSAARPNTYMATDSFRSDTDVIPSATNWPFPGSLYPGNYPVFVDGNSNGSMKKDTMPFYHVELIPAEWTNPVNLQAYPVPSLDPNPYN